MSRQTQEELEYMLEEAKKNSKITKISKKVLGFKEKDAVERIQYGKQINAPYYEIAEADLVPVVSVEEHNRKVQVLQNHIEVLNRLMDKESVSVEFLKDWCKGNQFGYAPPRVNVEELLKAVEEKE